MNKEIWKDIPEFEGLYQVSNLGRVKSLKRTIITSNGKKVTYKPKYLSILEHYKGYLYTRIQYKNNQKSFYIHRLVAQAFIPNPNNLPEVNHIDGDKTNNCVENLEWCNDTENKEHAKNNNLLAVGKNCCRKMTKEDVINVRSIKDKTIKELAKMYDISITSMSNIINYKSYKNIK